MIGVTGNSLNNVKFLKLQNIEREIPGKFQPIIRCIWWLWEFYVFYLLSGFLGSLMMFIVQNKLRLFITAVFCSSAFVPLSFYFWFRSIYHAIKANNPFGYGLFLANFSIHLVLSTVTALGIPGFGCGLIDSIEAFKINTIYALFLLLVSIVEIFYVVVSFVTLYLVCKTFGTTSKSFQTALQNAQTNQNQTYSMNEATEGPSSSNVSVIIQEGESSLGNNVQTNVEHDNEERSS